MSFRNFRERVESLPERQTRISQAFYFKQLPSTQSDVMKRARLAAPSGTLIVADGQSAGRGRRERTWESPLGKGLYFSLLLKPALKAARAPLATLAAGLGIGRTLRELGISELTVKWPNDLLIAGKKTGGILCEMASKKDMVDYLVVGVGLNVATEAADLSPETAPTATSLKLATQKDWDRGEVLEAILPGLMDEIDRLASGGPADLLKRWETESGMVGRNIRFTKDGGTSEGKVLGLEEDGQLKVELAGGGVARLLAEDTTLCS